MLHIHFHEFKSDIPNLDDLLEKHRVQGGSIIQYDRICSALVYARRTAVYEWVPNRTARHWRGCQHALWCAMLGWWSWVGLIVTGILIFNNLAGGSDFTRLLTTPPPLPGSGDDPALRELEAVDQRRKYLLLVLLLAVLATIILVRSRSK